MQEACLIKTFINTIGIHQMFAEMGRAFRKKFCHSNIPNFVLESLLLLVSLLHLLLLTVVMLLRMWLTVVRLLRMWTSLYFCKMSPHLLTHCLRRPRNVCEIMESRIAYKVYTVLNDFLSLKTIYNIVEHYGPWPNSDYASHLHTFYTGSQCVYNVSGLTRVRLIELESNANCCYLKKFTCKGTSRQMFTGQRPPALLVFVSDCLAIL
jgi:hypothetical protein